MHTRGHRRRADAHHVSGRARANRREIVGALIRDAEDRGAAAFLHALPARVVASAGGAAIGERAGIPLLASEIGRVALALHEWKEKARCDNDACESPHAHHLLARRPSRHGIDFKEASIAGMNRLFGATVFNRAALALASTFLPRATSAWMAMASRSSPS